jgi:hypothetical protein
VLGSSGKSNDSKSGPSARCGLRHASCRWRSREHRTEGTMELRHLRITQIDVHNEIRYIIERAKAGDSRIISMGKLIFFSTSARDAWLLDAEDQYALCLCRDGEPQAYQILDADQTFAINWPAVFAIEGARFIVREHNGRTIVKTAIRRPKSHRAAAAESEDRDQWSRLYVAAQSPKPSATSRRNAPNAWAHAFAIYFC